MRIIGLCRAGLCLAALFLSGCGSSDTVASLDSLETKEIIMPNGKPIRVEVMIKPENMMRGMMFRDSLPEGRGMLFWHKETSSYTYWMYQVKIPLDIIFLDSQRRVLGVSEHTPPCQSKASDCPAYGGYAGTKYVVELGAGEARKYGVQPGTIIGF
jgi:uncharacterized membrane protein (UPF0127 family)